MISYLPTESSCGGRKLGSSGTITTAGGKEVCHWLIQVGQGKKVNIDFTSFNIGDKDMVKIYDGQKYEEYITFTKKQQPRSFTGNSHFMRVIYIGEDTSGSGFSLNFKGASKLTYLFLNIPCYSRVRNNCPPYQCFKSFQPSPLLFQPHPLYQSLKN